ncbi:MAG: hypothetical protein HY296_07380 [Thaumarchaeota archaeon]|nr:hypothetical protein [Nitrososphaerota archaeon]
MTDVPTLVLAAAIGASLGGVATYFVFYAKPRKQAAAAPSARASEGSRESSMTNSELEKSRREMRTIMVERDLLSSALMKLYEAETEGRITKEEREMISKRYSEQIKELQSKMKDVELVVEVGELENLRNELLSLFEQKVQNIETRLDSARQRLGVSTPVAMKKEPSPKAERPTDLEKAVEKRAKPEMSESERRVKELRDEVMDALTRLEQIDIEKKQEA